ncbi:hypothetical protein [Flavobacterium collinsii]|uniref:Transglutaminase-like domain-containing protein n=1 Tax=Flavobacterium collinsii TaxID=1114861 RepID=A0A9W4TIJ8_9FLAO|nr:hypothetical protein [Flavobacterium collinsii]CAI2768202.1 conserved protein of unknown function [Flavobacterium collinsii]
MLQKLHSALLIKLLFVLFFPVGVFAQFPDAVEKNLKKAGNNRSELEKAITYCKQTGDTLKLKAIYFLISNIDIHTSSDYYWENQAGNKINYNELDYSDFDQAAKEFEIIKEKNPGLQPKKIIYKDIENIKADYLIANLEEAFTAWKNSAVKNTSFDDFCEYILPYRISVEPLQNWRRSYAAKFNWINKRIQSIGFEATLPFVRDEANSWFTNTWGTGTRKEPLPRLGSMQLLMRKQGSCDDLADLGVFTMRASGIPASVNIIPYWATSTGGHSINVFFEGNKKNILFDYGSKQYNEALRREPTKVLRLTYSKQPENLASFEESKNIPNGFLREQNYIDVTGDYWKTTKVKCSLYPNANVFEIAYLGTFNGLGWKPFWWGKITDNKAEFSQICQGTVVLPQYYINEKMIPAGPVVWIGDKESKVLIPDLKKTREVLITQLANYLIFKPQVTYKLFYWNDAWKLIDSKTAAPDTQSLMFAKVPKNALLLLVSSNSKGYERPFIVDDKGERTWF